MGLEKTFKYKTGDFWIQLPPSGSQNTARRQRPLSQPVQFGVTPSFFGGGGESQQKRIPMPEISEFSPQGTQYASSSSKMSTVFYLY